MKARTILYAEDDENDVFLMRRAFRHAEINHTLEVVPDGQACIDYLAGNGAYVDRNRFPWPSLLLLDLNLPRHSGLEVLEWIRKRPGCAPLPVIFLTSSSQDRDVQKAYDLFVNSYLVKPGTPAEWCSMVMAIKNFWLSFNCAPIP